MRQLVDLLNTFAGSAARLQSSLPAPAASAVPPPPPPPPPLSRAAAAAHPALAAAEAALAAKLADGAAACDADYLRLHCLNDSLSQQRGFAAAEAGRGLNRYIDVLPYDDNRVLLAPPGAAACGAAAAAPGGGGGGGHYINASPLRGGQGDVSWGYIAAQGPLRHTREAFWQMAAQEAAGTVVMLTNIVERGVAKCSRYFPEAPRTSKYLGRYLVTTRAVDELLPDLYRRSLVVADAGPAAAQQHAATAGEAPRREGRAARRSSSGGTSGGTSSGTSRSWAVRHYQYAAWPDHGVPASPHALLALCEELRRCGAHSAPIVVHCSAGIGRSGVFCVLDVVTRRLLRLLGSADVAAAAAAVDVAELVAQLRRQRLGMVQTRDQFVFCHTALLHFVRQLGAQQQEQQQQERPAARPGRQPAAPFAE